MAGTGPGLRTLLDIIQRPQSCAVLGAGASAPLVPLAGQLSQLVRKRLLAVGIFPATRIARDEIADRILGSGRAFIPPWDTDGLLEEELVAEHLSPGAVKAATISLLWPQAHDWVPPQYAAFNISPNPLALINYNSDGLASQYCSQHWIVNVHGTVLSAAQRQHLDWDRCIDALQEFHSLELTSVPGLLLPQREPLAMASNTAYEKVWKLLVQSHRIAIIGYSFGEGDDVVAYSYLRTVLRERNIPCVVVNPDARELAGELSESAKARRVYPLPMYWHMLACALLASRCRPRLKNCDHRRLCERCIAYLYNAFLDSDR